MKEAGFHFECEQRPYLQNRRENELKFTHLGLINKFAEEKFSVRAKKFYIKPLSDDPSCEIGFVTGKTSPILLEKEIFFPPNSTDSFKDKRKNIPAWTNTDTNRAIDKLLDSIKVYLKIVN
jgi:hypothetical protein